MAIPGSVFGHQSWGMGSLPTSGGLRPGMLLIILQHVRQAAVAKNYPAGNFNSTEVEELCVMC